VWYLIQNTVCETNNCRSKYLMLSHYILLTVKMFLPAGVVITLQVFLMDLPFKCYVYLFVSGFPRFLHRKVMCQIKQFLS